MAGPSSFVAGPGTWTLIQQRLRLSTECVYSAFVESRETNSPNLP
jgi:hypothetical protein